MESDNLFSLDGKAAVVIGGGGVLAGAMAEGFAQAGAGVAVADLNGEAAEARAAAIRAAGRRAIGVACDATKRQDLGRALEAVLSAFGRVDILLNAAGINSGTPFFEITEQEWQRAAQGDDNRIYPWGDAFRANCCNSSVEAKWDGTTPVTTFEGKDRGDSPFGVVEMTGNVREWCLTDHETGAQDIRQPARARVVRGGSWYDRPYRATASFRLSYPAYQRVFNVGFRVVGEVEPAALISKH